MIAFTTNIDGRQARRHGRATVLACVRVHQHGPCWKLLREGFKVARCTVARLMRAMGLQGAIRGKPIKTTVSDKASACPLDLVNRQFHAPRLNMLWLSDVTYVATWQGFVYVAFVIDAFARRIVGWRASRTAHAGFVLDALEQALHDRRPIHGGPPQRIFDKGQQRLPGEEAWLIGEWRSSGERKYYLSNLPADTDILTLAACIKARWVCEQAHQQMKEELGLDHFEGRSWHGLHRHALMTMIAYAFLQHQRLAEAQREKKSPERPAETDAAGDPQSGDCRAA